jgi:hypothetical protein
MEVIPGRVATMSYVASEEAGGGVEGKGDTRVLAEGVEGGERNEGWEEAEGSGGGRVERREPGWERGGSGQSRGGGRGWGGSTAAAAWPGRRK